MSFAQKLARVTQKAEEEKKEQERQRQLQLDAEEAKRIRTWAKAEIDRLKALCAGKAKAGLTACDFVTSAC